MDKDKILELAKKNTNRGKEYENKESTRSNLFGSLSALIVGACLFFIEFYVKGTINIGLIAVGMTAAGVQSLYEGIKLKRLSLTVISVFQILIALLLIISFLVKMVLYKWTLISN